MAKVKSKYVCQNCGCESIGYLGKCPDCGSWGSMVEEISDISLKNHAIEIPDNLPPMLLSQIEMNTEIRVKTGISEFDRVLGGGIVQGSLVLIAGDPGIGKSTILLQTSGELSKNGKKVLYISAEESASQIKLRADRLEINNDDTPEVLQKRVMENAEWKILPKAAEIVSRQIVLEKGAN